MGLFTEVYSIFPQKRMGISHRIEAPHLMINLHYQLDWTWNYLLDTSLDISARIFLEMFEWRKGSHLECWGVSPHWDGVLDCRRKDEEKTNMTPVFVFIYDLTGVIFCFCYYTFFTMVDFLCPYSVSKEHLPSFKLFLSVCCLGTEKGSWYGFPKPMGTRWCN